MAVEKGVLYSWDGYHHAFQRTPDSRKRLLVVVKSDAPGRQHRPESGGEMVTVLNF